MHTYTCNNTYTQSKQNPTKQSVHRTCTILLVSPHMYVLLCRHTHTYIHTYMYVYAWTVVLQLLSVYEIAKCVYTTL